MGATILRFRIEDWQVFVPGGEQRADAGESAAARDTNTPTSLRRRVSAIGQLALRGGFALGRTSQPRLIFCSRHGEFDRTLSLLRSIAAKDAVSPADFSLSVHNALAGLLSIASKNPRGHTAIAAGHDSFGFGMLEGAACLAAVPDEKVLVVYFDAPLPDVFAEIDDDTAMPLALALLLAPGEGTQDDVIMSFAPQRRDAPGTPPDRHAGDILGFLRAAHEELHIDGRRMNWRWARAG